MRSSSANPACQESYAIEKSSEFIKENGSNNRISLDQFTEYYLNKSLVIASDAKFKSECIEQWRVNRDDYEFHSDNSSPTSATRRQTTGCITPTERSAVRPAEFIYPIDDSNSPNVPPIESERLRPDPPLPPIRPGEKSPKVLKQYLRLGSSQSLASMDENFTSAPFSCELDAASDDSADTLEMNPESESNNRSETTAICKPCSVPRP